MATRRTGASARAEQTRLRIAQEAARMMAEEGIHDFALAKRKAVDRLGLPPGHNLPANPEIQAALVAHQQLFRGNVQPRNLQHLRKAALEAMGLLKDFEPRLVGPVLAGTADEYSAVTLHLFADTPEQLELFLLERNIPHRWDERLLRLTSERQERYPMCRFMAGDVELELTVFPVVGLRQPPLSPVDGRPMRRINATRLAAILTEER